MDWSYQTVLVTGASGFIGSQLTDRLVQIGANVRALAHYNSRNDWGLLELLSKDIRQQIDILSGDLTDGTFVRNAVNGCQVVFHLSALIAIPYSYQAPRQYIDTNVVGTLNVLQVALESNVAKVVHTSTSETYGTAQYTPIDESHPLQGQSPIPPVKLALTSWPKAFIVPSLYLLQQCALLTPLVLDNQLVPSFQRLSVKPYQVTQSNSAF